MRMNRGPTRSTGPANSCSASGMSTRDEDAQKKLGGATPFDRARWPAFATMVVGSLPAGQSMATRYEIASLSRDSPREWPTSENTALCFECAPHNRFPEATGYRSILSMTSDR